MAQILLPGRRVPNEEPTAAEMDLYFRSQCVAASKTRLSLTMIFEATSKSYEHVQSTLRKAAQEECNEYIQSKVLPCFPVEDSPTYKDLMKRGLARDRVAVTALVLAADMEKHNVQLTPDEVAQCKRRPALLRNRWQELERDFFKLGDTTTMTPEQQHAFRRTINASRSSDPQADARVGRQTPTLRMTMYTRTRAENALHCHSLVQQAQGNDNALDGLGQSSEVRSEWDQKIDNEIFVQFHFASPDHALLRACMSDDGAVATANDPDVDSQDPNVRRNVYKRRVPAAITYHDNHGNALCYTDTGFQLQGQGDVLWVADAAAVMNALHTSANVDYLWAEKNLW